MRGAVPLDRVVAGSFSLSAPRTYGSQRSLGSARFVADVTEEDSVSLLPDKLASSTSPARTPSPEEAAGLLSRMLYSYTNPLIKLGSAKHLEQDDLWELMREDTAAVVHDSFQAELAKTVDPVSAPQGVVWRALLEKYGRAFFWSGVLKVIHDLVMFTPPLILSVLLRHVAKPNPNRGVSFGLAFAMFAAALVENLTVNWYFHILYRMSLHIKVDMIEMLYAKSLRITSSVKSDMGVGSIVNLQSNDASKIWNLPMYLHIVWNGPFQIFIVMAMLVSIMGWAATMAGLGVTVVMIPMSTMVGKYLAAARREMLKHTDARVKLSTEVVTGIKAIKLYAWEDAYVKRIGELRDKELVQIRRTQMLSALNTAVFVSGPVLVSLAAFGVYHAMGNELTAAVAFPALALFNLLRFPILMFPSQVMNLINARVGLQRIQKFLGREEMLSSSEGAGAAAVVTADLPTYGFHQKIKPAPHRGPDPRHGLDALLGVADASQDLAIRVQHGSFSWDSNQEPVLKNVSLDIKQGQLVMVIGQVGCGKSSLLQALLGEMHKKDGTIIMRGSVAYTSQDPWIQNSTVRGNILMGEPFEEELYAEVLSACALLPDLEVLQAGDASEIGEKGINLSGGQKHRVALARAAYAAAEVYLLDDPLSAVDAHVGRHIFDQCICGLLQDTTRILVSHQLQYLPAADVVVVMNDGIIVDVGTYEELLDRGVDIHSMVTEDEDATEAGLGATPPGTKHPSVTGTADGGAGAEGTRAAANGNANGNGVVSHAGVVVGVNGGVNGSVGGAGAGAGVVVRAEADGNGVGGAGVGGKEPLSAVAANGKLQAALGGAGPGSRSGSEGPSPGARSPLRRQHTGLTPVERRKLLQSLSMHEKDGKIVKAEERAVGRVQRSVYLAYLNAWSSAFYWVPIAVLLSAMLERGLQVGQNFVLSNWSNAVSEGQAKGERASAGPYLSEYFILGFVSIGCNLARAVLTITGSITASRMLNHRLLAKVVRLPMSFFDSQPTGRLLNRFTKDMEAIDVTVSGVVSMTLTTFVMAVLSVAVIVVVSPLSIVAVLPLGYVYYKVQTYYIASSRELKRLDSLAFSPIFQHFSETMHGLVSIRAFQKQQQFLEKNRRNLDTSNQAWWPAQVINRWLSVRLELMGAAIMFSAAFFVTVIIPRNPGLVGLVITAALNLTGVMNWMVRQVTELEVNMNSVERVVEYEKHDEEAPRRIPGNEPPAGWPSQGAIVAENLVVRYRPELPPVLHGLNFSVRGMEKIGVCGRTGCGKSTLFMALYRIIEPCGGRILIDGIDTSTIGLWDLRSKLSLVPQDPVIFSGTIRSNLDPFQDAPNDAAIMEAVAQAGMDGFVRELEQGLDSPIKESGANISVGQRQLLCMARALLRNSKILVLDEATSNVDNATDSLIQKTIRTAFRDCTVLTIAHRLHTIIDSDRILLLDGGHLKEYDTPAELLRNPNSSFRKLVEETTEGVGSMRGGTTDVLSRALEEAQQ